MHLKCVCVCVCVCDREIETDRDKKILLVHVAAVFVVDFQKNSGKEGVT